MTLQALRHRTPRTHPCKNQLRKDGPPPISLLRDEVQKWYPLTVSAPSRENAKRKKKGVPPASSGDLVKRVDTVGNTICSTYDALHRVTSTTYSGPYQSVTPNKYFVYDAATVNSTTMTNTKGRLAEAYTATCQTCTKLTDAGFSYTARGEVSDVYESTPHSGGYYHVSASYWANGAVNQLSGISGLPSITYGADGAGRTSTVSAGSGQNPVSGTTYNVASLASQINLGSGDSDAFTYDPNTFRMTQYKFNVNSQSVIGALSWNAMGTLNSLNITDPFNSSDNQSCSYTHDDLVRSASVNCGSVWSQTFSYDAFGNISKSGTNSFQPTYSWLTNHMTAIGSSTPTYDANGNVTNDFLHAYSWDALGRPVTIDGVGVTYDALGLMVEQSKSGTYSEIVYAPWGGELAIMNAQTLTKAFVPLVGGSTAVYNSSGLAYYRHSDWLGSSRFASTPARAMYSDTAYAPFGEPYAQTGTPDLSFTSMNQDTVSNLYDFPAREYGIQGRWPSPDPAGLGAVSLEDPQSFNRYAYVRNSPTTFVDPLGLHLEVIGNCLYDVSTSTVSVQGDDGQTISNTDTTYTLVGCGSVGIPGYGQGGGGYGGGGGGGGGSGGSAQQPAPPSISPAAQSCINQANQQVQQQLQTFAGYSGTKLFGRIVIGAGFGALSVAKWTKYGGLWGMAAGAAIGGTIGAVSVALQDSTTIQNIQNSFMDKFQACLQKAP
jgi:RHS repeat-associated protein